MFLQGGSVSQVLYKIHPIWKIDKVYKVPTLLTGDVSRIITSSFQYLPT